MTRPGWHSTTPLSAWSSYDEENRAHSNRVMGLPDVAETRRELPQRSNMEWRPIIHKSLPNIAVSEFYFWQTRTPEPNVREAPNLECTQPMEGHAHFWYRTFSALGCPIIHGGRSFIAYSSYFTPPLAFSARYIIISTQCPGNENRWDPVLLKVMGPCWPEVKSN